MQFLSDENTEKLKNIISIFKKYRSVFSEGDVSPIGEKPSGRSFTGFMIKHNDDEYMLVFREVTEKESGIFFVPSEKTSIEILYTNTEVSAKIDEGILKVNFSKPRAYALIKLNDKK